MGIVYLGRGCGMGDNINARAFLLTYSEQKNIPTNQIKVLTPFPELFEGDGFLINPRGTYGRSILYRNFGFFINIPKKYNIIKCDECLAKNAGIDFSFDVIKPFNWTRENLNFELPEKFVTVNYGHDGNNRTDENRICIKMWSLDYWNELISKLNVPAVQIGKGKYCKEIKGTALNLVNKLSLKQSAEVLRRAMFHIDIEGGLVILNQHLGGKSVVLFGPCAIEDKGRSFNLNLRNSTCAPCYEWEHPKTQCLYMNKSALRCGNKCMLDLTPDYVIKKIHDEKWL